MLCFWVTNHIYIENCSIHHLRNSFNLSLKTKMWNVANWPPKFDGILLSTLGPIQGDKVQHLLVTWGRLECFFSFNLDALCKVLGADFNSYTNRNTGFRLNMALASNMPTPPCNNCDIISQFFLFWIMSSQEYRCIYVSFQLCIF